MYAGRSQAKVKDIRLIDNNLLLTRSRPDDRDICAEIGQ